MSTSPSPAIRWLTLRWLRRRWVAVLPIALLVAVGSAGTMVAVAAAQRTSTAYGDYLERAEVGDGVINPSIRTRDIDVVIRNLPNVEQVTTVSGFMTTPDDGTPRPRRQIETEVPEEEAAWVTVFGSVDGRYSDMDRPAVHEGRLPTGPREAVLSVEAADVTGFAIGDVVPVAFWQPTVLEGLPEEEVARLNDEVISPLGVEQLTIVGIVTLPDEVLPDTLYPRQRVIVSPDIAARYACPPGDTPPPGATRDEILDAYFPVPCATTYTYYSLSFTNGSEDVPAAFNEFLRRSTAMNPELAAEGQDEIWSEDSFVAQYSLISTETQQQIDHVKRSIRPTVTALVSLGLAAAAVTVSLVALGTVRELRRVRGDLVQWHQLGFGGLSRSAVAATPLILATLAGLLVGIAAGWVFDTGPIGLVRAVEPNAERQLNFVALLVTAAMGIVMLLAIVVLGIQSSRRPRGISSVPPMGRRSVVASLAVRSGSPALAEGVRAAYGHRAARPVLAASAVLVGAFVAAAVFATSMSSLVSRPAAYGWPWDVAAITGFGYSDLNLTAAESFDEDPAIDSWMAAAFSNDVTLNGEPVTTIIALDRTSTIDLTVLSGELPVANDEVAIGAFVAAERDIGIGDAVDLGGVIGGHAATVTGIVVFPTLGPFIAERVGTGRGLLVSEEMVGPDLAQGLAAFVGVNLDAGSDSPQGRRRVQEQLSSLDSRDGHVFTYTSAVRPPEIIDARSTRTVPIAVAAVVASLGVTCLTIASWASVRSRRRDVAVLRTIGFGSDQVRRLVRVQSLATVGAGLLVGVPVGVIAGRVLWRAFANQLGVVPDPASPWLTIAVTVAGGTVVALGAAAVPAHLASRASPAIALRAD